MNPKNGTRRNPRRRKQEFTPDPITSRERKLIRSSSRERKLSLFLKYPTSSLKISPLFLHFLPKMFIKAFSSKRKTGSVPVYLNVYDLTPINGYAYWLGLGVYHSGVQVHGVEYAYGAHDHPTTGIFEGEPRQCPGFAFRKSILIGRTDLGPRDVRSLMEELAEEYTGNTYNLISKNCNHFCNEACIRLTSNQIPRWVNRLAKIGFLCNCVLPVQVAAVRSKAEEGKAKEDIERKKLRSNSSRFANNTNSVKNSASRSGSRRIRRTSSTSSSTSILKV